MKIKFGPIQIFVSDVEKAKKWYAKVLGMKLIKEYPDFKCVLMKLGKIEFDIGTPDPVWGEGWNKVKVGGRTCIFFETDNIEKVSKETDRVLKNKGRAYLLIVLIKEFIETKERVVNLDKDYVLKCYSKYFDIIKEDIIEKIDDAGEDELPHFHKNLALILEKK